MSKKIYLCTNNFYTLFGTVSISEKSVNESEMFSNEDVIKPEDDIFSCSIVIKCFAVLMQREINN